MNLKKTISLGILIVAIVFLPFFNSKPVNASDLQSDPQVTPPLVWVVRAPMLIPRYNMGVAITPNGKIYVSGGDEYSCNAINKLEIYNTATDTWSFGAPMPTARWGLRAAAVDGKVYAIGGKAGCDGGILGNVEMYDPVTNTWVSRAPMPTPRMALGVAAASNGKIYAIGGRDLNNWVATVEEYDPLTDSWTRKGDMPYGNNSSGIAASRNGKIYVFGGEANREDVFEYDPANDTWAYRSNMPTPRDVLSAIEASNGKIYATGGNDGNEIVGTVEEYDPLSDSWLTQTSLPTRSMALVAASSGDSVYAIGGWGIRPDGTYGPLGLVVSAFVKEIRQVAIDIKPKSSNNLIELASIQAVAVAILSEFDFYAPLLVDYRSLTFGHSGEESSLSYTPKGKLNCISQDINQDGLNDLVCQFDIPKTGFMCTDSDGFLKGLLIDGERITGNDIVTISPCQSG